MFEFLLSQENEAVSILIKDHETVKALFDKYENAESRSEKLKIAAKTIEELSIHAIIEEEIFYPAVRKQLEKDMMNEADEEHHVVRFLVAELSGMNGSEDHYDAKYKVLSENVRHHIKEEERDMLPKVKALDLDFKRIADMLTARKAQLKKSGIPASLEEKMVRTTPRNDTPAREARNTTPKKPVKAASPAMMQAKGGSKSVPAKTAKKPMPKTAAKTTAKPAAKKAPMKIVSHRAATNVKSSSKVAAKKKR